MKNVKLINLMMWLLNFLLVAGIGVFAFNFLLFPKSRDLLAGIGVQDDKGGVKPATVREADLTLVKNLQFPLVPPSKIPDPGGPTGFPPQAELIGAMPSKEDPTSAAVILSLGGRSVNAWFGKDIEDGGQPVAELRGWRLVEVFSNHAVFSDGNHRATLRIKDPTAATVGPMGELGKRKAEGDGTFQGEKFTTKRIQKTDTYEQWAVDPAEIQDLLQHVDQRLQNDFSLGVHPQGGIVINEVRNGSQASMRGIERDDIIKTVNGIALTSLEQLGTLQNSPQINRAQSLSMTVTRPSTGKTITFMYSPAQK